MPRSAERGAESLPVPEPGRRRLPREARLAQLTTAAMPVVASGGLADFSLDEVTARAGVTRKLLYHYFPRGRPDVVLAVAERAGHELTSGWILDESIPLDQRLAANVGRIVRHAMQPSDAWRIYRLARSAREPEISASVDRFVEIVIASIAQNHLGTRAPAPPVRMAIRGYLAFFESVLDDARGTTIALESVLGMLNAVLRATVEAGTAVPE
ncbi:MAG TPA: TetR/AcrR family transcriptional regulator [Solirubrobacteraceae bacterium]|nr:TetR/AcrR family transcriptional regulator [Solirubrobacteraceae bacterium]